MREDLTRMEKLDEQTRFLAENRIETKEDLNAFREKASAEIGSLTQLRKELRNELKRVLRKEDPEAAADVKARISKASDEIKKNKKGLFLCDVIEARSTPMEKALEEIAKEQDERKEKKDNEQHLGRSGRTGRENVPGRS